MALKLILHFNVFSKRNCELDPLYIMNYFISLYLTLNPSGRTNRNMLNPLNWGVLIYFRMRYITFPCSKSLIGNLPILKAKFSFKAASCISLITCKSRAGTKDTHATYRENVSWYIGWFQITKFCYRPKITN